MTAARPQTRRLVRVLIIDDSAYVRRTLRRLLLSSREIEVVGTAMDGDEGLKLADELQPDVITLDLEMPRLDGFAFLRILMRHRPTPVIVVSSHSQRTNVIRALELGALDFVAKPERDISPELLEIRAELVAKVLAGAGSAVEQLKMRLYGSKEIMIRDLDDPGAMVRPTARRMASGLVVVGTSTGGPTSLRSVLDLLPDDFPYGIAVAQHMPAHFTGAFAERLNRELPFRVCEAEHGHVMCQGDVVIAPGGHHMEVVRNRDGFALAVLNAAEDDRYVPSVDQLFSSAAEAGGARIIAMILTGMGSDGAMGCQYVRLRGGTVLAEDKATAVVFGMPRVAISTGAVHHVVPLPLIARRLQSLVAEQK